jgi:4-amino-4-deoxy-L-arabinose transferase-like glycosyltransferase
MSVSDGLRAPYRGAPTGTSAARARRSSGASAPLSIGITQWSGYAWGAIAVTVAFIGLTCWWLTQDRSIPVYDAGAHLETALLFHDMIHAGNLLGPFNYVSIYPPFATTIGALAALLGGVNVAAPIIGENLVFVPLLTLGCYQTGRLLFGARAGLLATIFVLGSPLLIAQLHVFMLDVPEAALVAVSIWLLLACEDFDRVGFAALAGLTVGVGLLVKVQFAPFVVGIVLLALLRGWRNWRGLAAFVAVALIVAGPWYLRHISEVGTLLHVAGPHEGVPVGDTPPTLSIGNFGWYFWNILNSQFLAPLFVLIVGGAIWLAVSLFRHRGEALGARSEQTEPFGSRLELLAGVVVAWLLITLTPSHDVRYGIPLMPYLAVIATGWIVFLPRLARWLAVAVVVLGVSANTLGTTFGLGGIAHVVFRHPLPAGEEMADSIWFYSDKGFLVAGPRRDGDVPGLLEALHRDGVRVITWSYEQSTLPDFSFEGLGPLARIADLSPAVTPTPEFANSPRIATLIHLPITAHSPPVCTTLSDGTGVWVARYDTATRKPELFCPTRHPRFYDAAAVG